MKPKVLIAGAGIGGLTAALALLERGFPVEVHEQAAELKPLGAGVQISANGTRVLKSLGLEKALSPVLCEAAAKEVRMWNTGQRWPLFDLGQDSITRFGAPYWMLHRGDLHLALAEAIRARDPGAIKLGQKAIGVSQSESGVTLHTEASDASGDILIGADGVHSVIRNTIFGSPEAKFTGLMAWRGLADMDKLPEDLRRPVGVNWVGPGAHVITYPLRGGRLLNFVGVVENAEWQSETWTEKGTIEEAQADFQGWNPLIHQMISALDAPYRWALVQRDPLANWTAGRVTLLGDACHPTLPFLAQGAVMAIEDGYVLAECLAKSPDAPQAALRRYQDLRIDRTTAIVNGSAANTGRFHNPALSDPEQAIAYVEREWAPEKVRQRYDWLFSYDATTVCA